MQAARNRLRISWNLTAACSPISASGPPADIYNERYVISFETDVFPELIITEQDPGLEATAYGLLADFLTAVRSS